MKIGFLFFYNKVGLLFYSIYYKKTFKIKEISDFFYFVFFFLMTKWR